MNIASVDQTNILNIVLRFEDGMLTVDRCIEFNSLTNANTLKEMILERHEALTKSGVLEVAGFESGVIRVDGEIVAIWNDERFDGWLEGSLLKIEQLVSADADKDEEESWATLYDS